VSKTGLKGAQALVLLSSGLDSTINLYQAKAKLGSVAAVTFDYGQRAAKKEIEKAKALTKKLKVPHLVIDIKWLGKLGGSSLTDKKKTVPQAAKVKIDDLKTSQETAKSVWVPNRNGVFLNIAASIAEANSIPVIIPGFNIEEAQTFPDNSKEFISALNESFVFSTNRKVKVECYTTDLNKTEIVKLGQSLGVDFKLVWPCYFSYAKPCGQCESCLRFIRAIG
jgi:7-cyano-7-deazaguanine synthase